MVTYFLHIITITTISITIMIITTISITIMMTTITIMMITILITMANTGTAVSDWLLLVISRLLQLTVPPLTLKKTRDNDENDEDENYDDGNEDEDGHDDDDDAYSFPTLE